MEFTLAWGYRRVRGFVALVEYNKPLIGYQEKFILDINTYVVSYFSGQLTVIVKMEAFS